MFTNCIGHSYICSVELVLITQHRAEVLAHRHRSAKSLITLWLGLSCFIFLAFWALLTSMPQQHALWSTAPRRNAQKQGSAVSCWGTEALLKADVKWHSARLGTESYFILRVWSVNVIQFLAPTMLYTQTQGPFSYLLLLFQSYHRVLSSSLAKKWWL